MPENCRPAHNQSLNLLSRPTTGLKAWYTCFQARFCHNHARPIACTGRADRSLSGRSAGENYKIHPSKGDFAMCHCAFGPVQTAGRFRRRQGGAFLCRQIVRPTAGGGPTDAGRACHLALAPCPLPKGVRSPREKRSRLPEGRYAALVLNRDSLIVLLSPGAEKPVFSTLWQYQTQKSPGWTGRNKPEMIGLCP